MKSVLKIVNLIVQSLIALLPLLERFFSDNEEKREAVTKKSKELLSKAKELRDDVENYC